MSIEIDQSGRIEDNQKHTIIAYANNNCSSIRISATNKKLIFQAIHRAFPHLNNKTINILLFSTLVFILLKTHISKSDHIIIDTEFTGHNRDIKDRILLLARRNQIPISPDQILFGQIGKKSPAHYLAIQTFRKQIPPNQEVTAKEVLMYFQNQK